MQPFFFLTAVASLNQRIHLQISSKDILHRQIKDNCITNINYTRVAIVGIYKNSSALLIQ